MPQNIRFYDIPCKQKGVSWSPNTLKIAYTLNYKKLAYEVVWVEFPDIEETLKSIGVSPTMTKPNGEPKYTLPAIHDLNTDVRLADSIQIAEYLEQTYPSAPEKVLFPPGTKALQHAFTDGVKARLLPTLGPIALQSEAEMLNPRSEEYFRRTRVEMYGRELMEMELPKEKKEALWKQVEAAFGTVNSWIGKEDRFVMGDRVCFVDFSLAGMLVWCKVMWGEDSEEWKRIVGWHDGRWGRLVKDLEEYDRLG
ncbi:hypothetical protein Moror_16802 [Moniliophthora roreri MCA 2997]|uniref:GST N-terminal domain-containing protein n=1 Tax=Moniliophthora roreri (strain MCA 2997) TaxID=1381753 RepID=V2YDL5_MONRO|nr:hypothetical protein Moror_16802 [Moniliophthora roreri MCA 2997]